MKKYTIEVPNGKRLVKDGDVYRLVNRGRIEDLVKTVEDAKKEIGPEHETIFRELVNIENCTTSKSLLAFARLRVIVAALNEGWTPGYQWTERRWIPMFQVVKENGQAKFEFRAAMMDGYPILNESIKLKGRPEAEYTMTSNNVELMFKDEELADYAGSQFLEIYKDYILG